MLGDSIHQGGQFACCLKQNLLRRWISGIGRLRHHGKYRWKNVVCLQRCALLQFLPGLTAELFQNPPAQDRILSPLLTLFHGCLNRLASNVKRAAVVAHLRAKSPRAPDFSLRIAANRRGPGSSDKDNHRSFPSGRQRHFQIRKNTYRRGRERSCE